MWFLFVEIFFLITLSFFVGAGVAALALRIVLRGTDKETTSTSEVTS
jgi:hypothetical protein